MSLFSKQSFPHEESAIQTQRGTRSLYRLPPLHGNRNYLSLLSGLVMQHETVQSVHFAGPFCSFGGAAGLANLASSTGTFSFTSLT
jgi:hypothetical protein